MKATDVNTGQENKKKALFINFTNTKRIQWNRFRRYGMYSA